MKDYLRLLKFLKGHRKLFAIAVVMMFFSSIFEVCQIGAIAPVVDIIFNKKPMVVPNNLPHFLAEMVSRLNLIDPQTLFKMFPIILLIGIMLKQVFTFFHQYFMSQVSQLILRDVRFEVYKKIQQLSMDYFSAKRTGELVSRITHDVQIIENAVSYGLTDLFKQTFVICLYIITAFVIFPKGALLVLVMFPLIGIPMSRIGKRLRKFSKGIQEKMADISTLLLETISGVKLVKAYCTEDYEIDRFKQKNQDYYKLNMKSIKRLTVINPISEIFGAFCGIIVFLWIGKSVMNGEISFGVFAVFFGSIMSIVSPIKKIGNVNALVQKALAANDRIYEVLNAPVTVKQKPDAQELKTMEKSIVLKDIIFSYDAESGVVLNGIDLEVKKGELVAVVGPTGTGKSTLINLIPRFYDPNVGEVLFDGINVKDITFKSLRGQIGMVTQETILFNDTVRSNITYGYPNASQKDIEEAAKKAFAHQFIMNMPQGYDTTIGDRGFRLSGGEKQRLAIARAILKNAPVLILDEATSALDSESERYVQEALNELMQGRTVVAIAHRLSTIKKADKIVVLQNGKIVGLGKHEELLKTCELYNKLHTMQFQL